MTTTQLNGGGHASPQRPRLRYGVMKNPSLERKLSNLGLDVPASLEERADALEKHYLLTMKHGDLMRCQACDAILPEAEPECPFCGGNEGEDLDKDAFKTAKAQVEARMNPTTETGTGEKFEGALAKRAKRKAEKDAATKKDAPRNASGALITERDLDDAVAKVHALKVDAAKSYYDLGLYIKEHIVDPQLWKLRTENGEARYKTIEAFFNAELGLAPRQAYKLMDTAKAFTPEQLQKWGPTKLSLVLEAPKQEQPKLLEKVEQGASKREIEREVRKFNAEEREEGKVRETRDGRAQRNTHPTKKREEKITVASLLGSSTVKLYQKPSTLKNLNVKELAPAKMMKHMPFGIEELENGVKVYYQIRESASGQWELKIVRKRDEE